VAVLVFAQAFQVVITSILLAIVAHSDEQAKNNAAGFNSLHDRTYGEIQRLEAKVDSLTYRPGP